MKKFVPLTVLLTASFAPAQTSARPSAHPNLGGTWKLNAAQSDFGSVPPPIRQVEVVTQAGDEFAIAVTLEREETRQNYTLRFQAGGEAMPLANGSFPDDAPFRILSVKGEWQGSTLVVTQKVSFQGSEGTVTARYTVSSDGKVLRKETHVSMSAGEFDTKTVYNKQ
ncbi:hypothetical protein [Edaphobacter bradus]|uniref:hypothetical protein n=1 Tax=Edaphobacter bradus TaxID=2259016 RepID=UPI0021DFB096|nr:hypothetical protein [Edaphobacter bradus]